MKLFRVEIAQARDLGSQPLLAILRSTDGNARHGQTISDAWSAKCSTCRQLAPRGDMCDGQPRALSRALVSVACARLRRENHAPSAAATRWPSSWLRRSCLLGIAAFRSQQTASKACLIGPPVDRSHVDPKDGAPKQLFWSRRGTVSSLALTFEILHSISAACCRTTEAPPRQLGRQGRISGRERTGPRTEANTALIAMKRQFILDNVVAHSGEI